MLHVVSRHCCMLFAHVKLDVANAGRVSQERMRKFHGGRALHARHTVLARHALHARHAHGSGGRADDTGDERHEPLRQGLLRRRSRPAVGRSLPSGVTDSPLPAGAGRAGGRAVVGVPARADAGAAALASSGALALHTVVDAMLISAAACAAQPRCAAQLHVCGNALRLRGSAARDCNRCRCSIACAASRCGTACPKGQDSECAVRRRR